MPEDYRQIGQNLNHAQQPITPQEQLRAQQASLFERQAEELRQAQEQEARWHAQAKQHAQEVRQYYEAKNQGLPATKPQILQGQVSKTNVDTLLQEAFYDPNNPEQNIIEQANGQQRLDDSKLGQAELNLDRMLGQGTINQSQYQQLAVAAKAAASENWLKHDGVNNGDGTVSYRGVTIDQTVAPLVAYADVKRVWDKEVHLSAQELEKAAKDLAIGTYNFFIGDDINTLRSPNATLLAKTISGGSLALTLSGGFIEKAGLKLGGKIIARVAGKSEHTIEILKQSGLNERQIEKYVDFVTDKARHHEVEIRNLPSGGKVYQTKIPANNIPGSYAVWQTQIDELGNRVIYEKTSFYPDGTILHSRQYHPRYVEVRPPKGTR